MSTADKPSRAHRYQSRIVHTLVVLLRTRITTGVLTILPVVLTLWVIRIVFAWMRDASQWVVKAILLSGVDPQARTIPPWLAQLGFDWEGWRRTQELGLIESQERFFEFLPWFWQWGIAIFSVLLTIFFLYVIGLFAANLFGRRIIERMEQLVERVPLIKTVYRLPKQVIASFSGDQMQQFKRVALVPFPQERMRCVGFITNVFNDSITGEELCSVFIATTPNPTTGYLQIIRRRDLTELNWDMEEAIRCVMSGGILKPEFLTIVPNKDLPENVPAGVGREPIGPVEKPAPDGGSGSASSASHPRSNQ